MLGLVFGRGLTKKALEKETYRERFSDYLPYIAYDDENRLYLCQDNTIGFVWECSPLFFAGEKTYTSLEGILSNDYPQGSVLQFILHADDYIKPFVDAYKESKVRDSGIVRKATERFCEFLQSGRKGIEKNAGIPVRNYRLFVALKIPVAEKGDIDLREIYDLTKDRLEGAGLVPRDMPAGDLLALLRRLFNGVESEENYTQHDEMTPLNKQIIYGGTKIKKHFRKLQIGNTIAKCVTPKNFPREIDPLFINSLVGGWEGVTTDADQIRTPFMLTVSVVFEDLKGLLHTKCNLLLQQQAVGSFAPSIKRKQEEYLWAVDNLEKGIKFLRVIPTLWLFSKDEKKINESVSRVKRIWEGYGFIMQEDGGILPILLISALPLGLYNVGKNISKLDRDFIAQTKAIARILPVQADYSGTGITMPFIGRKGQITGIDIFSPYVNNHNAVISATTGAGKSFLVNYIVFNNYASGAAVRIIDIGGSYKKLVKMLGAKYIDVGSGDKKKICLNPFSFIREPKDDIPPIVEVVSRMVYTAEKRTPSQTEVTILKNAVLWAYQQKGNNAGIDDVYEYLNVFPKYAENFDFDCEDKKECAEDIKVQAHTLAFNIYDFTSDGMYGQYFNGEATFDISTDDLVVLELERLKTMPDLFEVVTLQVINAIASDLYLSKRDRPRFIIFDEAWQFLNDASALQRIIEEGYRKARKYHGSFTVVIQSDLDMLKFGGVGKVIFGNSEFKLKLESGDYEQARKDGILDYDDFTMRVLKSVKSNKPKYSEIFVDSKTLGMGVVRLCVDPYSYFVYTSEAKEYMEIEKIVETKGVSYAEAIEEMVKRSDN